MVDVLQARELFHLAFLRRLARALPPSAYALKGGCNLRFFFGSIRYSEDMDLDVSGVPVHVLAEKVASILGAGGLGDTLRTYGIDRVVPPDLARSKQTETVQRFKVHLLTRAGENLFTKVEFSRRGLESPVRAESVAPTVLSAYQMASLIVPHYTAEAAVRQKLQALRGRRAPQARDVFDLHTIRPHAEPVADAVLASFTRDQLADARERVFGLGFETYRDQVVAYLPDEDRAAHESAEVWDEIRLSVVSFLERGIDARG